MYNTFTVEELTNPNGFSLWWARNHKEWKSDHKTYHEAYDYFHALKNQCYARMKHKENTDNKIRDILDSEGWSPEDSLSLLPTRGQ